MNTYNNKKESQEKKKSIFKTIKNYFFTKTPLEAWQELILKNPEIKTPEIYLYVLNAASPSGLAQKISLYNLLLNRMINDSYLSSEVSFNETKNNLAKYVSNYITNKEAKELESKIYELEQKKDYNTINSILENQIINYEKIKNNGLLKKDYTNNAEQNKKEENSLKPKKQTINQYNRLFDIRPEILLNGDYA